MSVDRAETVAFLEGVTWVTGAMREAALRVDPSKHGAKAEIKYLRDIAEVIEQGMFGEAVKRYPKFDPLPKPMKSGESTLSAAPLTRSHKP